MDLCLLLKKIRKNIGKNTSKKISGKYSPKKHLLQKHVKLFQKTVQKIAEATGDLIILKIVLKLEIKSQELRHKIVPETAQYKTEDRKFDNEKSIKIPEEMHVSPEKKDKTLLMNLT